VNTWKTFEIFKPEYSMILHNYSLGHMPPIWNSKTFLQGSGVNLDCKI
jgi:hypothetical protein